MIEKCAIKAKIRTGKDVKTGPGQIIRQKTKEEEQKEEETSPKLLWAVSHGIYLPMHRRLK